MRRIPAGQFLTGLFWLLLPAANAVERSRPASPPYFELQTHRMDVDVDGAPNAYGPPGSHALDSLQNAHYRGMKDAEIVGYLTEDDRPDVPVRQTARDPFPGLYISQTAYTDRAKTDERDVTRYVDATRINYVVLGDQAHRRGAVLGDFVAVYSRATGRSVFAIVGDDGNPSGDEGSLHLLQELGYPFHDGRNDSVETPEIVERFYPHSNPHHLFFRSQALLDAAAERLGFSRDFTLSPLAHRRHPNPRTK
ncbi:MAG TPA: hypothetical protein VKV02_09355 [Acidobacteriaceae bacterium]|nr:hypothetical protein [Acidobacteriaceae bacterium]